VKRRPYLIGLTGNIATGKSEVAAMLADLGARVIDADQVAHQVMAPDGPAYGAVVETFGREILAADGSIDRSTLGAIVFRDPASLGKLEAAVHPAVAAEVDRLINQATEQIAAVEAIKLIEAGMHRHYDALWVVTAPRALQISRLVATRGLSESEAALRVDAQPPQEEKAALADLVLVNEGSLDDLRAKVKVAWAQIPLVVTDAIIRPVRRDDMEDAAGLAAVLNSVIAEERYTALAGHFTPEDELAFLQHLGPRGELFVAELAGRIVGFQTIEPFAAYIPTMAHVCELATYVEAGLRGQGIGQRLAWTTLHFARMEAYEKAVVFVLARNEGGLGFYRSLGFEERGLLTRQAKIDGEYYDQVILELHLADTG
jgi:dephospho-CoA kinase